MPDKYLFILLKMIDQGHEAPKHAKQNDTYNSFHIGEKTSSLNTQIGSASIFTDLK